MNNLSYDMFDADTHYYEPDDCFTRHIEPAFKSRTVWIDRRSDGPGRMYVGSERCHFFSVGAGDSVGPPGIMKAFLRGISDEGGSPSLNAINALDPRFYKDDLYVFVVELDSQRFVAHGSNLRLVGRDFGALADRVGKPFGQEALDQLATNETAEFDYQWKHPITGDTEHKHAYARKVGNYLVAVGYYQPNNGNGEQASAE